MKYRILLNTETQIFTVISTLNTSTTGKGQTIQEAIQNMKTKVLV
jgi:predicted RNase H-like HicB family nuclease